MSRADRSRRTPRRSQPVPRRSLTPFVLGGVGAVVLIAAVAAVVIASLAPTGPPEPAAMPVTISGEPLPALADPAADSAVGQQVPTLSGIGLDGQPIAIGPEDGPMAIVVVAHWCAHCQAELPGLVQLIAQGGVPEGVTVVGLSTAIDALRPNYPPSAWFEREGWAQPTLIDDASSGALQALGLNSFPGFVFVDAQGAVTLRLVGEIGADRFGQLLASLAPLGLRNRARPHSLLPKDRSVAALEQLDRERRPTCFRRLASFVQGGDGRLRRAAAFRVAVTLRHLEMATAEAARPGRINALRAHHNPLRDGAKCAVADDPFRRRRI